MNENFILKKDLHAGLFNIYGSNVHLSNAIMNLILNSYEAIKDYGELTITTENRVLEKPLINYEHIEPGEYVTVSITDTGIGIEKKDLERIFEPFYTRKVMGQSGTGLGMAIVWGTVKDHEGYIDVESEVGKGTSFTLYFPSTRDDILLKPDKQEPVDYTGSGESILIIDDVEIQRDICEEILTSLNYKVFSVPSGEKALEYLKSNKADLIVLDMIMEKGMDGLETYKEILKIHPGQKAVIASGYSETDLVRQAQELGAGAYIKKPYTLELLGIKIKKELKGDF
jgi:CheY-like chemotaxis protein